MTARHHSGRRRGAPIDRRDRLDEHREDARTPLTRDVPA